MATEPFKYRDKDGNLRLDEVLGERYVQHYIGILESSNEKFAAMQLAVRAPAVDDPADHVYSWREPRGPLVDGYELIQAGRGASACSSSQELALLPEICWDVCGYYARLGVHWKATHKEIREAYLEKDPTQQDERLHYVVMQLKDRVVRRAYDLQPLGGLFMGDRYVRETIERQAAIVASRQNAEAEWDDEKTTQGEVLKEWGFDKGVSADEARERLRAQYSQAPLGSAETALGKTMHSWDRQWAYYRLADLDDDDPASDTRALEAWQVMLCRALTLRGLAGRFAVGTWPGHGPKIWLDSNQSCIIFFIGQDEPPSPELAMNAVRGYLAQENQKEQETTRHAIFRRRRNRSS